MPDSFDAHEIARKSFESGRRGYDPQEVRAYLHEVSSQFERLQREHRDLKERAERAEARLGLAAEPDEAMLLEVLGEETTRVLTSAREAAAEIKAKAESAAERIVAEATSEAAETRAGALQDADRKRAEATSESEALLLQARTELDRRSAEAEEAATRIRDDATAAAQAARDEGKAALTRAEADAEAIREAAREEGRTMVAEAQAVRERVLRDLAARRKKARQQVEKLNAGRERLLQAYDVVRGTIDEATTELHQSLSDARLAGDAAARRIDEEDELTIEELDAEVASAALADLTPTEAPAADAVAPEEEDLDDDSPGPLSGEVPVVGSAPAAAVPVPEPTPEPTASAEAADPVDLDERRTRKQRRRRPDFAGVDPEALTKVEPPSTPDEGIRILAEPATEPEPEPATPEIGDAPAAEPAPDASEPVTPAVADEPEAPAAEDEDEADAPGPTAEEPAAADTDEPPASASVGDLFARLRSEAGDAEASDLDADDPAADAPEAGDAGSAPAEAPTPEAAADDVGDAPPVEEPAEGADDATGDGAPFRARDAALAPIDRDLAKRLKRALADEQNEVLDRLRRAKPQGVDDLLPTGDEHAARWAETVDDALRAAATAGAEAGGGTASSPADLADELARSLTGPLRDRIDRSFAASDGNLDDVADRVRALYREWKGQRLQEAASHYLAAAYARGVLDGVDAGASVEWVLDPEHAACPDCSDNVLAGALVKGDEFPTGQTCAPAHPGCRCLVVAVSS